MKTMTKTAALSTAQQRFLADMEKTGESRPPWGYRDAGRDASAWHRTASSLAARGLVKVLRSGRGYLATFTKRGVPIWESLAAAVARDPGGELPSEFWKMFKIVT